MKKSITILVCFLLITYQLGAQDTKLEDEINRLKINQNELQKKINALKSGTNKFRMTGFANIAYHQDLEDLQDTRFDHIGYSPIVIWKPAVNLFFESELHIELEGGVHGGETGGGHGGGGHGGAGGTTIQHSGSTSFDLGYASIGYFLGRNITLQGGKFLSPIGTFSERYHPSWINKLPSAPLGLGHGAALPASEVGIQVRGGFQLGKSKLNYAVFLSNGPILEDGKGDPDRAGALVFTNFKDNNQNKAIGGRIGFLPLSNSSLELGISGLYANKTGDHGTEYENIGATIYAGDLNYIKTFNSIKGIIQVVGQWSMIDVEDTFYKNDSTEISNGKDSLYTFNNNSQLYYIQIAYRPMKSKKKLIRSFELVARYDAVQLAENSNWEFNDSRITIGLNYWIHQRSVFKLGIQIGELSNIMLLQWAIGF